MQQAFAKLALVLLVSLGLTAEALSGGYDFEMAYTADVLRNASGGIQAGGRYLDNLDLILEVDLRRGSGQGGSMLFVHGLYNNGTTFADELVGDLLVTSSIDAPGAWRIYELWYQCSDGPWSVRTGLYDLNSEFDVSETGGLFLNSAHGIGAALSQTGENGPSIFPVTSLAVRAAFEAWGSTLRMALLDGVPGDRNDPSSNEIDLSGGDGALIISELEVPLAESARTWVGFWRYTAEFERPFDSGRSNDNDGWYLGVESNFELGSRPTAWFVRYGRANELLNPLGAFLGAGLVIGGMVASRPEDQLGLSVASGRSGASHQAHLEQTGEGAAAHETQWELTYRAQIRENLALQPDVQYVQNPGASHELKNAWIIGLRVELAFGNN